MTPSTRLEPTLSDFRSTRKTTLAYPSAFGETIYSYWNNESESSDECSSEELLHIVREASGLFYLQIANIIRRGSLEDLEEQLYEWAKDEGWFDR